MSFIFKMSKLLSTSARIVDSARDLRVVIDIASINDVIVEPPINGFGSYTGIRL